MDMVGGPGGRDTAPSSRRGHLGSSRSTERNAQLRVMFYLVSNTEDLGIPWKSSG